MAGFKYSGLMDDYSYLPFMDRINNPNNYDIVTNDDGSISTHRMSAEIDENGQAWAFPMIVQTDEGLHEYDDPFEALDYNKQTNNAIPFDSIDEALEYSKTYKPEGFNNFYKGLMGE
jgi:hypothetical protein